MVTVAREHNVTTTMTSTRAFIDQVNADWDAWTKLVDSIPDERKHEPGAVGFWSVKDTIAHIAVYEDWTLKWLEPALDGQPARFEKEDDISEFDFDEQNAIFYEQHKDRSLEDIQAEATQIHQRLMDALNRLPENAHETPLVELSPDAGVMFREGTTIPGAIDGCAADHYRHHTADVQRWLEG